MYVNSKYAINSMRTVSSSVSSSNVWITLFGGRNASEENYLHFKLKSLSL
uniref:Uncharacterized protein n=1 Tax=Lepeophtheirus salmonis TaxID=72036 RepID=A0A0K2TGQ4_LEPSM